MINDSNIKGVLKMEKFFYESFSKAVLEYFYPEKFSDLQKEEKPDFINDYVGLEITLALKSHEGELKSFFEKYNNKPYKDLPSRLLRKLGFKTITNYDDIIYIQRSKKNGKLLYFYSKEKEDYILLGHISPLQSNNIAADNIMSSINKKLKKLNSIYKIKKENYLAILVEEQIKYFGIGDACSSEIINEIFEKIKAQDISNEYEYMFDKIYLIFFDKIIIIDTASFEVETREIPVEVYRNIYDRCK